ncbi:MAG: sigma-70 family RNA polymerase sigma factor [Actinomycetota bacterium]
MSARKGPALSLVKFQDAANISGLQPDIQVTIGDVRSLDAVARLVEWAKDGDKDAFGQIFRLHRDAILRFARLRLGAEADDVVSEVFTRAWITLNRYEYTGLPFVAWLYGIARHVVADELTRQSRTQPKADLPESLSRWAEDDRIDLFEAIEKLPTEQRQVIEMKYFMGMRNAEVADVLNTSVNAVNGRQWRALAALRDQLGEQS